MTPDCAEHHSYKVSATSVHWKIYFVSNKRQNNFQNITGVYLWQGEVGDGARGRAVIEVEGKVTYSSDHAELEVLELWFSRVC